MKKGPDHWRVVRASVVGEKGELALRFLPYARRMLGPPREGATHATNSATHLALEAHHADLVRNCEEQKAPRPESAEGNVRRFSSLFRCPMAPGGSKWPEIHRRWLYTTSYPRGCQAGTLRRLRLLHRHGRGNSSGVRAGTQLSRIVNRLLWPPTPHSTCPPAPTCRRSTTR